MTERTVTLPMAEVLAQAPELSPWYGWEEFDGDLVRQLDGLDEGQRMLSVMCLDGIGPSEKRTLQSIVYWGWMAWIDMDWLERVTQRKPPAMRQSLKRLADSKLIRIPDRFARNRGRTKLIIVSGWAIIRAYDSFTGGLRDVTSRRATPDSPITGGLRDVTSRRATPDSPITGGLRDVTSRRATPDSFGADELRDRASRRPPSSRARAVGSSSLLNIQSNLDITTTDESQRDDTSRLRGDDSTTPAGPPEWWPSFLSLFRYLNRPAPPKPAWSAFRSFLHPLDSDGELLLEACARFLDTYSNPSIKPARNVRNVCRSIYRQLLVDWQEAGHVLDAWASELWFADEGGEDVIQHPAPRPVHQPNSRADPAARETWLAVLRDLQQQLPRPTFETWLAPTEGVADDGEVFVVEAPTSFAVEWLESRMFHALQRTLEKVSGRPLELQLRVITDEDRQEGGMT